MVTKVVGGQTHGHHYFGVGLLLQGFHYRVGVGHHTALLQARIVTLVFDYFNWWKLETKKQSNPETRLNLR